MGGVDGSEVDPRKHHPMFFHDSDVGHEKRGWLVG